MYRCDRCGKDCATTQGLAGHIKMAHGGAGPPALTAQRSALSTQRSGSFERSRALSTQHSALAVKTPAKAAVLTEAEQVALGAWARRRASKIDWGRVLVAVTVGLIVSYLIYRGTEGWSFESKKKAISPLKLVGGLITGLG